jgi:hypothetical protein
MLPAVNLSSEQQDIERAVQNLSAQFPQIPRSHIDHVVAEVRAEYADSRIRDFVPLFIERKARRRLSTVLSD